MSPMLGAIILALAIVVAIPVGTMMSGAVAAAILGWSLESEGRAVNAGSEYLDLNR